MPMSNKVKDILIVGQGIAGSMLGWFAEKAGLSFDIYDKGSLQSASFVSSGIINPVTGPKFIKSWLIDALLPVAINTYKEIEVRYNCQIISELRLWSHINTVKDENLWDSRMEDPAYEGIMSRPKSDPVLKKIFPASHQFGLINKSARIDSPKLLSTLRALWLHQNILYEKDFVESQLKNYGDCYVYDGEKYKNVILACGYRGVESAFFKTEGYQPVKGEVLICEISNFPIDKIIKYGKFIVPIEDQKFWVGSNYQHDFHDNIPDKKRAADLKNFIDNTIKMPYQVKEHLSGIRSATRYRRPFIGEHDTMRGLYLFNGLGTKGITIAPYFSKNLINAIANNQRFLGTEAFYKSFGK